MCLSGLAQAIMGPQAEFIFGALVKLLFFFFFFGKVDDFMILWLILLLLNDIVQFRFLFVTCNLPFVM